jgi:hypothetical protein
MATSSGDSMMNATLISDLPPPMISNMNDNNPKQAASSSYQDLIKNLDIKQMTSGQNIPMPASIQMQQQMPRQTSQTQPNQQMQMKMSQQMQMQQQMPRQTPQTQQNQQMQMKMPQQMQMQQQMQMPTPDNAMEMLHAHNSTYPGSMPQSAPVGDFSPAPGMEMAQGPIVNSLLPDPLFFNPPPQERKRRRPPPPPQAAPPPITMLGGKVPAMDLNKIKPAILVASIVFALLSWGAPAIAKRLTWTVDIMTGKFTSSGLIVISLLTGGIYLGISEIIRNYGNGV